MVGVRGLSGAVESDSSTLHQATGLIGAVWHLGRIAQRWSTAHRVT